jgi:itaconate CoA-transferase
VAYSAPAAIFVGQPRHYGAVPAIGGHGSATEPARARSKTS